MEKQSKKPRKVRRMSPEDFDDLDLDAQFQACLDGTAPTDKEYFEGGARRKGPA